MVGGCVVVNLCCFFFFFKQKTAYELRISDWSSDVCSSDLSPAAALMQACVQGLLRGLPVASARPFRPLPQVSLPVSAPVSVPGQIGRASCRERVCPYVEISGGAVSLKNKTGS